jgi:hypothetical protein
MGDLEDVSKNQFFTFPPPYKLSGTIIARQELSEQIVVGTSDPVFLPDKFSKNQ